MQNIRLGVNIDHIATLRQARGTRYPEVLQAAAVAEQAGADSITVHLREDRRHIQERDVVMLSQTLQTAMNLEMAMTPDMLDFACQIKPRDCCLVPERREELTTEGGLDVLGQHAAVTAACTQLAEQGIAVSLFIDPEPEQIRASLEAGAPMIELHTGNYADADNPAMQMAELERLRAAAALAAELGLEVHAGHGLHYHNVQAIAALPEVVELNIGHAIIAQALFSGLAGAVVEMKTLIQEARQSGFFYP